MDPLDKSICKIGQTTQLTPEQRARTESATTGRALPLYVYKYWEVTDAVEAEKHAFRALDRHRFKGPGRGQEWFRLPPAEAERTLSVILQRFFVVASASVPAEGPRMFECALPEMDTSSSGKLRLAYSPAGSLVVAACDSLHEIDTTNGELQNTKAIGRWGLQCIGTFRKRVVACDGRSVSRPWDGDEITDLQSVSATVDMAAFSPSGELVALTTFEDDLHVFTIPEGKAIHKSKPGNVWQRAGFAQRDSVNFLQLADDGSVAILQGARLTVYRERSHFSLDGVHLVHMMANGSVACVQVVKWGHYALSLRKASLGTPIWSVALEGEPRAITDFANQLCVIDGGVSRFSASTGAFLTHDEHNFGDSSARFYIARQQYDNLVAVASFDSEMNVPSVPT